MENFIKAYKINATTGLSNEMSIPAGFVVSIDIIQLKGANQTDNTALLELQIGTYKDEARTKVIPNDDIANVMHNTATLSTISDTVEQVEIESGLFDLLETTYGEGNVVLIDKV